MTRGIAHSLINEQVGQFPRVVRHAGRHGRSEPKAPMDTWKIVPREVEGHCRFQIVPFLAEGVDTGHAETSNSKKRNRRLGGLSTHKPTLRGAGSQT